MNSVMSFQRYFSHKAKMHGFTSALFQVAVLFHVRTPCVICIPVGVLSCFPDTLSNIRMFKKNTIG